MDTRVLIPRILLLLLFTSYLIQPLLVYQQTSDWVLEGYSYRSRSGGDIYPGSSATVLTVDLRYTGSNNVISPYACLVLPEGFTIRGSQCTSGVYTNGTYIHKASPGDVLRFTYTIDVSRNTTPGEYYFTLNISYYIEGSSALEYYALAIPVTVSSYPRLVLTVEKAYFTPYGYPGSNPVNLYVELVNNGNTTITSMDLTLELPGEYFTPSEVNTSYTGNVDPGGSASVLFNNIQVKPYTQPGSYTVRMHVSAELSTSDGVTYRDDGELVFQVTVGSTPPLDIRVLDYSLTAQYPLPGLNNTGIRFIIQSLEPNTVRILYLNAELNGAFTGNGSRTIIQEVSQVLSYMDTLELRITGLNIAEDTGVVEAYIELNCMVNRDQSWYPASYSMRLAIPLEASPELNVRIVNATWSTSTAYPGATGLGITVTLLNNEGFSIRDGDVVLRLPMVFRPGELVARNIVVNQYSLTEIVFTGIDIAPDASPGTYEAYMTLRGFLVNNDGSTKYVELAFTIGVRVSNPGELLGWRPVLELTDYFWGDGTPTYMYPGNPRAGLTIVVINTGIYQVSSLELEITTPSDVTPLTRNTTCATTLPPGSTCQAVFYLDLSGATPGVKYFNVTARYRVNAFNTGIYFNESLSFSLLLPEYRAGEGVRVASSSWAGNNPVYPGERGAVFTVQLVNLEPYPVYSLWVSIEPPLCMMLHEGLNNTTYIPGPVNSLQSVSISYTIDVKCSKPGQYIGYLNINYYVQYAGGGFRRSIREQLLFTISSLENTVEVVKAGWVGGAPTEGGRGVSYMVVMRNNGFPSISNPVLTLYLPQGLSDALTGSREATVTPSSIIPSQQLQQILQEGIPDLSGILQMLQATQAQQPASIQRGDLMVFIARLNILNASAGLYEVPFTLSFTDHWGYVYSVNSTLAMQIQYQPSLLTVHPASPIIYFANGSSILDIDVVNEYDSPVYNVYIALIPASNNAIPQGAVKYVDMIPGNSSVRIRYEIIYNPISISIGGGATASPSSAVFTVSLIYRDVYGYIGSINTTLSAIIRPFINLELTEDTSARYYDNAGKLSVNGVILNTGLAQARSVYVKVFYGDASGYMFIGDIDPSSQTPFRVDLYSSRYLDNCSLIIEFKDEYNTLYTLRYDIPVQLVHQQTTTMPQTSGIEGYYYLAVILVVALFLVAVFYLLYRYINRHRITVGENAG